MCNLLCNIPSREIIVDGLDNLISVPNIDLLHGDCLELYATIPDESIDCIIADPPYFLSNGTVVTKSGRRVVEDKGDWDKSKGRVNDLAFTEFWLKESRRVLKASGTIWISGTQHNIYDVGHILKNLDFYTLNDIVWFKSNSAPNLQRARFTHSHENLIWARKEKDTKSTFNYDITKNGTYPEDSMKFPNKQMRTVWSIPLTKGSEKKHGKHPTQKPISLYDRILKATTSPGDTVLDPFMGSGTSGIAAIRNDCDYIGIEQDAGYMELANARIQEELAKYINFKATLN